MTLNAFAKPILNQGFRLQWEPAQDTHVLLYPEGMVKLNGSAAEILRRCDGTRTLIEVIAELERSYDKQSLARDIRHFVESAITNGWLRADL
jgi:pyrroloquinoline quinone biosynthesis protein D